MIGQRGVPASFGGVEHHVEELGARLADLGHEVVVYCRTNYTVDRLDEYRGMRPHYFDTINTKHFDAIAHSARSSVAAILQKVDVVHYHAMGPGLVAPLPRLLSRAKVVQTIHGLDHERSKWGRVASGVLGLGCWMSARVPDATVVVSKALQDFYATSYERKTHYIPNGVEERGDFPPGDTLRRYGLTPGSYVLFVGRLVPEKAPDMLLRAFHRLPGDTKLVIVGGSSFTEGFVKTIEELASADPRVVMTGYLHGDPLDELYANAGIFVLPSVLEGMPLTLLEAAAHGVPILASDIPPHVEVLGEDGPGRRLFRMSNETDLRDHLMRMLSQPEIEQAGGRETRLWVHKAYSWDNAASELAELYRKVTFGKGRAAPDPVIDLREAAPVLLRPDTGRPRTVGTSLRRAVPESSSDAAGD